MKFALCDELRNTDPYFMQQHNVVTYVPKANITKPQFSVEINFQVYKKQQALNEEFRRYSDEVTYKNLLSAFIQAAEQQSIAQQCVKLDSVAQVLQQSCDLPFCRQLEVIESGLRLRQEASFADYSKRYGYLEVSRIAELHRYITTRIKCLKDYCYDYEQTSEQFRQLLDYRKNAERKEAIFEFIRKILLIQSTLTDMGYNYDLSNYVRCYKLAVELQRKYSSYFNMFHLNQLIIKQAEFVASCSRTISKNIANLVFYRITTGAIEDFYIEDNIVNEMIIAEEFGELVKEHLNGKDIDAVLCLITRAVSDPLLYTKNLKNVLFYLLCASCEAFVPYDLPSVLAKRHYIFDLGIPDHFYRVIEAKMAKYAYYLFMGYERLCYGYLQSLELISREDLEAATFKSLTDIDIARTLDWISVEYKKGKNYTAILIVKDKHYSVSMTSIYVITVYFERWNAYYSLDFETAKSYIRMELFYAELLTNYLTSVEKLLEKNPGLKQIQLMLEICDFSQQCLQVLEEKSSLSTEKLYYQIRPDRTVDILLNALSLTIDDYFKAVFDSVNKFSGFNIMANDSVKSLKDEEVQFVRAEVENLLYTMATVLKSFRSLNNSYQNAKERIYYWFVSYFDNEFRNFIRKYGGRIGVMNSKVVLRNKLEFCRIIIRIAGETEPLLPYDQQRLVQYWDSVDVNEL